MVGKNNQYLKNTKEGTKVESYSIKKFKVGTASVVIGASIFLGAGAVAQASEEVSNNTTIDNTTNAGEKAEVAPKEVAQPTKVENTKESVAAAVAEKVGAETPKTEAPVKAEVKAADKTALKLSIDSLEKKLKDAKNADEAVLKTAREELAKAKEVFAKADATQGEVNAKVTTLDVLTKTVAESEATAVATKEEAKKAEDKAKSEEKQTAEVKAAKKELTQVTSEAEVTNVLAKEAIRKNEVKIEAKPAVEKAVAKNEEVIKVANELLGNDETTKEQIARSLEELGNSIKAVYSELENAGVRRDGRYGVALSAGEGYTDKTQAKSAANGEFTATSTGKTYELLDNNEAYRIYVHGYQSENSEIKGKTSPPAAQGGRTDLPLSSEEAKKLSEEAPMWSGKIRPTGSKIGAGTYGSGGAYEFIATEIYGYNYDQGNHYAYIKDATKRFSLSDAAIAAGYRITDVEISNLIPGLAYNKNTDSIEGYVSASIQNGVYDLRYELTVTKPDGTTTKVHFRDLKAGWMGWQDTTAPRVAGDSTVVTVGDTISHDLKYLDNDGFANDTRANYKMNGQPIVPGKKTSGKVTFTGLDGTELTSMSSFVINQPHLVVNGQYMTSKKPISNTIPGLTFDPTKNLLEGKASDAGIYTLAVLAKDFNNATNSKNLQWTANGQETHESVTIAVAPKITVKNVEAYAKELDVTISKGANTGEIRMPDGTVTKFAVKDGKWVVAEGTTNSAVSVGTELGAASETADSTFKLAVTSDATKYVGVDNIAAKASTDKVKASLQREVVTVRDKAGNSYVATLNAATGKYAIPDDKAYELVNNGDGTSTLTERRVYTEAQPDGAINYIVYEFKRVWTAESNAATLVDRVAEVRKNGEVKQVVSVDRTITELPFKQVAGTDGVTVQVTYDSVSKQWAASDGSTVTATKTNAGWSLETSSGFRGYVAFREATGTQLASIQNAKPAGTSTSYSENKDATVDLIGSEKADVSFKDKIDDKSDNPVSDTIKTKLTVTAPDGTQKVFDAAQAQEDAYIAAQRTAAAKTQAAAAAVKNEQDSINDLARQQEIVDRETKYVANAEEALNKLKLRTVSPTAQELAEQLLADARARLAKETEELRRQEAELPGITAKVAATRQEALDAEAAVETARTALKTAAEANLANAKQYVLSQVGRYKVTVRDVDSNGVVTTPTVGGTDAGEVTEDAVAETTYYIVVTEPKKTSGVKNEPQSTSMEEALKAGQPAGATVSDYKLVDPETGKRSTSVTTTEGTYSVNPTTGEVTFTPKEGFVGNATPVTVEGNVTFNDEAGNPVKVPVSNTYTPTVYGLDKQDDESTGKQGQPQNSITGAERFSKLNDNDNTPDGTNVDMNTAKYSLEGANPEGKVVVDGEGTYSIDPATGVVTFEPLPTFKGKAQGVTVKVTAKATDASGKELEVTEKATYTPEVEAVVPTATPKETSGKQGQPQTQDATTMFEKGDDTAPIDNTTIKLVDPSGAEVTSLPAMKDGKQVGTYTLDPATGVITFQPNPDFTGTPEPAKVTAADKNGTKVTTTYTPTVTPVTPTATPKETSGKQGQPQTQDATTMFEKGDDTAPIDNTTIKLVDPSGAEVTSLPAMKDGKQVGTYTLDPATGVITFQPNPDFTGTPEPAKVTAADKNGTKVTTTYTPTVTPVTPTATPKKSSGKQGQPQKKNAQKMFHKGDDTAPIDNTTIRLVDPTTNAEVTSLPAMKDGQQVGTYTLDPATGVITFQPNPDFTGTPEPAKVTAADKNGTKVTTTYTPTVTPVEPTGTPVTSEGKQGQPQTGKPTFTEGDPTAPITITEDQPAQFIDPATGEATEATEIPAKDEKGNTVGKYTIDPLTGVVTFTPNKDFVGTPVPAKVEVKDKNGTPATATYTPTVTPVKPTGEDVTTSGKQGQPQEGTPKFTQGDEVAPITINEQQPAKFVVNGQPVEDKEIPATKDGKEIGKYKIDPLTGVVTFTPNKDFTGTPDPATVQVKDANGTPTTANYTPTVTPVVPTATPKETTGKQAQPQTQDTETMFTKGDEVAPIDKSTVKLVDLSGNEVTTMLALKDGKEVGTYTIDPTTGVITFQPNKDFVGTPDPAKVVAKDTNGTKVETTYTPTVTPVKPTGEDVTTSGKQGQPQEGTPKFTQGDETAPITINEEQPAKFVVNGQPVEDKEIPATKDGKEIGKYKIDPLTGVVTFTPNKDFTGTPDPATVQVKDKNGTPTTANYTPTVTPVVPTATPKETTGKQAQPQTQDTETMFTKGDEVAPIDKTTVKLVDPSGNEVTTLPATKDGKEVGNYTLDPQTGVITFQPNKDFVGTPDPVKVVAKDTNGTKVETTYTPTVTPVTPTSEPKETTGIQGATQEGTPTFTQGDETAPITINEEQPAQFVVDGKPVTDTTIPATKDGKQIGTYTIDPTTGKVTFTPNKDFVGTPDPATVQVKDKNGTPVTAKYTPTVTPVIPTAEPKETTDIQGKEQTGKPEFKPGNPEVPMDDEVPATFEDGTTEKVIPGEGTYKVNPDGTVTFTPEKGFTGKGTGVTVKRVDKNGTPVTAKYTPTVTPVTPTAEPKETTDIQGKEQTGKPTFTPGNPEVPMDDEVPATFEDGTTEKVVPGEGTYKVNPDGTVTFTPEKTFTGTAKGVTVKRVDKNGTPVTAKYTPTVTPVTPTAESVVSSDIQGKEQTGKPTFTPGNPEVPMDDEVPATFEDGTTEKVVPGEGTYKVNLDGTVTFTPEKGFTGVGTGVTVKRVDKNGTPVTAKYTPTVTPVTPEGTPAESTNIQGAKQEGTPEFKPGNPNVPIDETVAPTFEDGTTEKVVPGEGTYTIDKDGKVTFTPEPQFTGTARGVTIKRVDKNGTPVTAKYTPTVTPVTPTSEPVVSSDIQGKEQTGKPEFKPGNPEVPMDDETPATFEDGSTEKVVPGEGTYKVSPDGTITFTPEKSFTGTAKGVTVKRVDKNGTPVTATYTPTVTPVTPEGTPAESTGLQGIKQEGTPEFKPGNPNVPIDETVAPTLEGADKDGKVVVPGEGTYTIDKDGKVTFTPEPQFVGKAKGVTVKRVDKNGTPVTATYTPTVKPVEPTGKPAKTINKKGETQTGKPTFTPANPNVPIDEKVPATFEDGSTEKVVPGEGKYTVAPDGTVTFVPEKDFVGKAKGVAVRRVDTNGNPITSMYLPVVTPELPEANPAFSVDVQGVTQTGKPTFIPGSPNTPIDETVPATFEDGSTEKVVPGEGTYTVAPDGTVTFVPEKDFVGTAQGVLVVRVDTEGNLAYGVYIPTVLPLTPSSEPEVTKGPKGQVQKGKPTFKPASPDVPIDETRPATFEDGSTTKVVKGEGTYTVAPDGTVTFTPEKDFEGKAKGVTVKRYDKKGTPILATYTPIVTSKTTFVDTKGNVIEGYPAEDGTTPKKDIPGYKFVETKNLPNGDVEHVYEKVTTPAPTPTPVVEKSTTWTDEEGNPLRPPVNGIEVPGEIPGYEFGRTVTDKDGNVRHIFKKTSRIPGENRTTTWTDENGNSLKLSEKGTVEAGKISGYEFVRTVVGEDGNVRHIFRKATNEKLGQRLANTGTTETNTGLAGLGLAILGGLLAAARRKNDKH